MPTDRPEDSDSNPDRESGVTASLPAGWLSNSSPERTKRKRVLLVDVSAAKRELRAGAMRELGMDVDCACDITEARSWWRADLYNLVLINMENQLGRRDRFCEDIRRGTPPQQLAFLVGKPEYLADLPNADGDTASGDNGHQQDQIKAVRSVKGFAVPEHWGIMEASRRISAVRSESAARAQAIRNRPTPPRDLEVRESRRERAESQLLNLEKEEVK